jgi:cation:H+ antiporter
MDMVLHPMVGALAGLLLLMGGGQLVVHHAAALAARLGVSPLVIGLVIVGFGTSAPELMTGARAAMAGLPALAFGNAVGASLANLLLVLPLAALLRPILLARGAIRAEGAAVVAAAALFAGMAFVPVPPRTVGLALMMALGLWLLASFARQTGGQAPVAETSLQTREGAVVSADGGKPWWQMLLLLAAGIAALVVGADLMVSAAMALARRIGIGEDLIGLSLLSLGTCLPELATAFTAARRRQTDIVVGNVLGSCLFNLLAVGGVVQVIAGRAPDGLIRALDAPLLALAALAVVALLRLRLRLGRPEALLLLGTYATWLGLRLAA